MATSWVRVGIASWLVAACGGFNSDGIGSGPGDTLNTASETGAPATEPTTSPSSVSASDADADADSDSDSESADTSSSPSTSATTSPSTTVDPDGSGTTPESTETSTADDDGTSTDPSTTSTSGMVDPTVAETGEDICAPNGNDSACFACARMSCCGQLMACQGDAPCECVIECYEGGGDPFGCFEVCGVSAANQALAGCVGASCKECL